ncbi:MAG: hypothetical protein NT154_21785 [Verrucomicrobia bacterium]|nr:hypothetical protein [Verrucomicrobiota bacterium]
MQRTIRGAESAQPSPAIVRLIADMPQREAERRAWLERNKPDEVASLASLYASRGAHCPNSDPEESDLHKLTWSYLEHKTDIPPSPDTTWRDYAVEAAANCASIGFGHLQNLASNGDQRALASLADLAAGTTEALNRISRGAPERLQPIARRRFLWPFLKAWKERFGDDHKSLLRQIQLGYELPFSCEALGRIRRSNITSRTAVMLLCRLDAYRQKRNTWAGYMRHPRVEWEEMAARLAPFSAATWLNWFEAAWKALLDDHDGKPEAAPELRRLGLYRASHSTESYGGTQKTVTSKTRESNIRDGIREKLRKAVKRLSEQPK